jgi:hypothetical protein
MVSPASRADWPAPAWRGPPSSGNPQVVEDLQGLLPGSGGRGQVTGGPQRPFTRPVPNVPIAAQLSHKRQCSTGRSRPACTRLPVRDRCARTGSSVPPGRSELVTYRQRILGDLISYQNDGKYSTADFRKAGRS